MSLEMSIPTLGLRPEGGNVRAEQTKEGMPTQGLVVAGAVGLEGVRPPAPGSGLPNPGPVFAYRS